MGPAPLPPHERPWRHPSELGPPEHEPAPGGARLLVVSTATFGLVLVALLAVAVTPPAARTADGPATTLVAVRAAPASPASFGGPGEPPVVAPVGRQGLALTTAEAVEDATGTVEARLPNGDVVEVSVVTVDHGVNLAVVALPDGVTAATFTVAPSGGGALVPDDTVVVHAATSTVVPAADVASIGVGEGTPVSDGAGTLLGLCTLDEWSEQMIVAGVGVSADRLLAASGGSD